MSRRDEVAIVGYAARVPGAANIDAFWSLLRDNRSSVGWITQDRFATQPYLHPSADQIGRSIDERAVEIEDNDRTFCHRLSASDVRDIMQGGCARLQPKSRNDKKLQGGVHARVQRDRYP